MKQNLTVVAVLVLLGSILLIPLRPGPHRQFVEIQAEPFKSSNVPFSTDGRNSAFAIPQKPEPSDSNHKSLTTQPIEYRQQVWPHSAATSARTPDVPDELSAFALWMEKFAVASEPVRVAMLPEGTTLAAARRKALATLIRTDPARALAVALPSGARAKLPIELISLLEEPVAARGELSLNCVLPADGMSGPTGVVRRALIGRREYNVFTYGVRATLATLASTFIEGIAIDADLAMKDSPLPSAELPGTGHAADNQPGTAGVTGRPSREWAQGTKRVLIIRVDFSDLPGTPVNSLNGQVITEDFAVNLFNGPNGVRDFYDQTSFGQTALQLAPTTGGDSPDVTGVLRLPQPAASYATSGNNLLLHSDARTSAQAAGFPVDAYDRVGVVFSSLTDLPGSQINYGGFGNILGKHFWVNGAFNFRIAAHEIAHNYGLQHANLWQVNDGNPVSDAGTSTEYGDIFDIMGNGHDFADHFSPWHKSLLQWIPDAAVTVVSNSGTYRVFRFDHAGASLANPLALKIVRDLTHDYWIGLRRGSGNTNLDQGAYVLWGYNQNQGSHLLDLNTPGSDAGDAALPVGATFNDSAAGIAFRTVTRGGSGADEFLDVEVTFQPRLQFSSATYFADEQSGAAAITVDRLNSGIGNISVSFATSNDSAQAPSDFTGTNGILTWAHGDLSSRTILIPIVPDGSPEGAENLNFVLSNPNGAVITGPASATVTIVEAGSGDPSFAPGLVNRSVERVLVQPDGRLLIGGWFDTIYQDGLPPQARRGIARLESGGLLDTNYASAGGISSGNNERVEDMARQADGKVIIVGNFTSVHGTTRNRIARLNEDGSLDAEFNPGSGADGIIRTLVLQPDGRIILGGEFTSFDGTAREYLVRLLANGGVDTSFVGPDFFGTSGWRVLTLALQSDGRILVGGSFVLPAGAVARAGVCRLTSSGAMDPSFNGINEGAHQEGSPSTILAVRHMALQLDGSILIAGDFTAYNNNPRSRLARLTSSGTLDVGFTPSADDICFSLLVQPDDKILVGGNFTTLNGVPAARYGRLLKSGALDPDFNVAGLNTFVNDFALQPDGRLVFGSNVGQSGIGGTSNSIWRVFAGLSELPGTIQWSTVVTNANEGSAATLTVTRVGGAAGALEVNFATVPGTAGANDFTSVSGTLRWANGETASKTVQILTASDPEIEGTESVFVNLGQPLVGAAMLGNIQQIRLNITEAVSGFASWQAANFTPAELANPAISGDSADPDLDGINNLLEYAFGLPPKLPSTTGVPTGAISSVGGVNYLTLTFRRRMPLADLTYTPQTASAVIGGWNADALLVGIPVSNGDGTETVTYRDSVAQPSSNQRFMRVQVQRTP